MERGLKSADPQDCTAYTGWAGSAAEQIVWSRSSPELNSRSGQGRSQGLNDHSRAQSRTVLLLCVLIH